MLFHVDTMIRVNIMEWYWYRYHGTYGTMEDPWYQGC